MKADFSRWASAPPSWISTTDVGPAVSSRVRIARNIAGLPFPHNASPAARRQVLDQVFQALKGAPLLERSQTFSLGVLSPLERSFLMERMMMSHQHATDEGERGLVVSPGEALSVMVNEEDHVRAAAFRGGMELDAAWDALSAVDEAVGGRLPIAFDESFGFIAACPTNLGTGLRASTLLHLPALALAGRLQPVLDQLSAAGLTARGFYGEGTSSLGDLIQVSNSQTLGQPESAILRNVEKSVRQIVALEAKAASDLMGGELRLAVEDRVHRALGTLASARLLDYSECARCLSLVRFGLRVGVDLPISAKTVNDLLFVTQPAHLRLRSDASGSQPEAAVRAELVRQKVDH